jgi:hypothetical protein
MSLISIICYLQRTCIDRDDIRNRIILSYIPYLLVDIEIEIFHITIISLKHIFYIHLGIS